MKRRFIVTVNRPGARRPKWDGHDVPQGVFDSSWRSFVAWWCMEYLRIEVKVIVRRIALPHSTPEWVVPRNNWHGVPAVPWTALQTVWAASVDDLAMLHAASRTALRRQGAQDDLPLDSANDSG